MIGCGAYGKVYKATEPNGKEIALKVVEGFGGLEEYETQTNALEKEFQIVKSLHIHPRIIQFFDIVKDDDNARLIIVMEYLEGGSLADKISKALEAGHHLKKIQCLRYLVQILEGLTFLHANKIYHSDIKPENILLTKYDEIKICDFGIAVQIQTESSSTASHLKGTTYYMSPERLNGDSRSAENDMWSVGATFVTMITGNTLNHNMTISITSA